MRDCFFGQSLDKTATVLQAEMRGRFHPAALIPNECPVHTQFPVFKREGVCLKLSIMKSGFSLTDAACVQEMKACFPHHG